MKLEISFLRSKVAQRIFILFICCSLLPITILTILFYSNVTKQLGEQSKRQLNEMSKNIGMDMYERLLFLEAEMHIVASRIGSNRRVDFRMSTKDLDIDLTQYFKGLVLINNNGTAKPVFGRIKKIPALSQLEERHLQSGKTVISTMHLPDYSSHIFMSMASNHREPRKQFLLGEINPSYFWGMGNENPWMPAAELCILDHSNNILFSTLPPPLSFPKEVMQAMDSHVSGQFEWEHDNSPYISGYWSLFLKARYCTPKWTVVLSESKEDVLAPTATFKKVFPLIILMTILVVILLSIIQIRRNLIPLEKLQKGTRRIAKREFDSRVVIKTGDEFEELAASFNTMADQLGKQFKTLTTITEIDRSILSALDTDKIIEIVLNRLHDVFPSDCISVTLFNLSNQGAALTYIRAKETEIEKTMQSVIPGPEEIKKLYKNREFFITKVNHTMPHYFKQLAERGMKSSVVFPLFINQILSGIIILGYQKKPSYNQADIAQARQVADQVAVALSNTRLIEELEQLHLGTLTALARSIDAKSRWTAGHSERVTKLALKIGSSLGLSPKELELLRRGGLLHDIGKIGVPASILDKSGKLTDIEDQFIREHVRWGVHILEPITAFADIIPIILHHHEQFDGTGYPDGLTGEEISLNTRILTVADAFDALTSHRPYRPAESQAQAIEIIKQGTGSKFDPRIVQVFLDVMQHDQKKFEDNDNSTQMKEYM
jgi:putative nucleotidyltransferase with HDIG domain